MVASTIVLPREGSFPLAFLGRVSRVPDPIFSVALVRNNLALKRIVDLVACGLAGFIRDFPSAFPPANNAGLFVIFYLLRRFASLNRSPIQADGQKENRLSSRFLLMPLHSALWTLDFELWIAFPAPSSIIDSPAIHSPAFAVRSDSL